MDRSTVVYWPEPQLAPGVDPDGRPVVVLSRYRVAAEAEREFVAAMALVRDSRLRTGAVRWGLYRDGESVDSFVELFVVPSWEEHLRQHHERLTGTDRAFEQRVSGLAVDETSLSHLISVDVPLLRLSVRADVQRELLPDAANLVVEHRELFPVRACLPADIADEDETLEVQDEIVELPELRGFRSHTEISALAAKTRLNRT